MARSATDIELLARVMAEYHEVDVNLPPLPWRSLKCPSRVGVMGGFPALMEPCTATARALQQAAGCLRDMDRVELVDIDITDLVEELFVNAVSGFFKDEQLVRVAKGKQKLGEPLIDGFSEFARLLSIPVFLLRKLGNLLASPREMLYIRALLRSIDSGTAAMEARQEELRKEVIQRCASRELHAFFCTVSPSCRFYPMHLPRSQQVSIFILDMRGFSFSCGGSQRLGWPPSSFILPIPL
jgi:Asp-tRNA(Asn)/Glu-tRNA(Gln) amidotransferase A subunit family amidase